MKKIVPFNNLILVEPLQKEVKESKIFVPDKSGGRYARYKVLAIGEVITWMKVGDIVIGNFTPEDEVVNGLGHKLINSKDIFAKEMEVKDS